MFQDAFLAPVSTEALAAAVELLMQTYQQAAPAVAMRTAADGQLRKVHRPKNYPAQRLGLISSLQDATISYFLGFGQNNCSAIDGTPGPLPGATFQAGLIDLRDSLLAAESELVHVPPDWDDPRI